MSAQNTIVQAESHDGRMRPHTVVAADASSSFQSICMVARVMLGAKVAALYQRQHGRALLAAEAGDADLRRTLPWRLFKGLEKGGGVVAVPSAAARRLLGRDQADEQLFAIPVRGKDERLLGAVLLWMHGNETLDNLPAESIAALAALAVDQLMPTGGASIADEMPVQRSPVRSRQRLAERASQLVKIGAWEVRVPSLELFWSDEMYRLAKIEPGTPITAADALKDYAPEHRAEWAENFDACLRTGQGFNQVLRTVNEAGVESWLRLHAAAEMHNGQIVSIYGTCQDITAEIQAQAQLRHLAHHDVLTGLPNRAVFQKQLRRAAARAVRRQQQLALLIFDLDRFKDINDMRGHDAGDKVLVETAMRVSAELTGVDLVARLGGDEFVVLARIDQGEAQAVALAEQILTCTRKPVMFRDQLIDVDTSVGIALYPVSSPDIDQLLRDGDLALYQAKAKGRGRYCLYDPGIRHDLEQRRQTLSAVKDGLQRGEFEMFYQPIVRLLDGQMSSFEALIRWRHPQRGVLAPAAFQVALDDMEVSAIMGDHVIAMVAAQAAAWRSTGLPFSRVALNVAPSQFRSGDFAQRLLAQLDDYGVPAWCITLEVTESVLLGDESDIVGQALRTLQDEGMAIALDDFGTGYASLTHLKSFPVDRIKIDRSFVRSMLVERDSAQIVRAIIELAHALGIEVVAEGVESLDIAAALAAMGCDYVQGYAFGKPAPSGEATDLLEAQSLGVSSD
jgi:diguanylate cyclase (GGDEF)-like protein